MGSTHLLDSRTEDAPDILIVAHSAPVLRLAVSKTFAAVFTSALARTLYEFARGENTFTLNLLLDLRLASQFDL